jgi:hypothetical protein
MRIFIAVACLLPFALAAEAAISRHSPEEAIKDAYATDERAIHGDGSGVMRDNALRARFFSRSILRSIAADEMLADARDGARERLIYALVFERGEWRIDDIDYAMLDGQRRSLRGMLEAN